MVAIAFGEPAPLGAALEVNCTLVDLNLSYNKIGAGGGAEKIAGGLFGQVGERLGSEPLANVFQRENTSAYSLFHR